LGKKLDIYANPAQQLVLQSEADRITMIMGRGGGKGHTLGLKLGISARQLPRAKAFIAAANFGQILNVTFADIEAAWYFLGYREYDPKTGQGHYVKWQKPPAHFDKPYHQVNDYSRSITFINGFTVECLSIVKGDQNRGGSFDQGYIDESGTVKRDVVYKVLRPKIRGNEYIYKSHLHGLFADFTSSPWLQLGKWVYETEELEKKDPVKYLFVECSGEINYKVLGKQYYKNLKAEMTDLEYRVEVKSERVDSVPNCFYPTFNEARHLVFDTQSYQLNDAGLYITSDSYLDVNKPLELSWDFNAHFTSLLVCQQVVNEQRIDNNLFLKESKDKSIERALAEKFCEEYKQHKHKKVDLHGDRNGNSKRTGNPLTAYEEVQKVLKENGWESEKKVSGLDSEHHIRHLVLTELLSEANPRLPKIRINANKCRSLITSIKNTPIFQDYKKDKRSELSNIPQERATHLSDCFDNILFRKFAHMIGHTVANDFAPIIR
jgi:hypothetical protein